MSLIRLLVVDDHTVIRHGLRRFFALIPDMELVAEASSGPEALALALALAPDVILLDLMMPEMDGLTATTALKALLPHTPILILTTFCTRETVLAALRAGASGFLLKDIEPDELARAIYTVRANQVYLHSYALQQLTTRLAEVATPPPRLTAREQQVGALIASGMSNKEIAAELGMSEKTVSVHASNLMAKLGLRSRTQVARYMLQFEL